MKIYPQLVIVSSVFYCNISSHKLINNGAFELDQHVMSTRIGESFVKYCTLNSNCISTKLRENDYIFYMICISLKVASNIMSYLNS